jgi:hypothetical protein
MVVRGVAVVDDHDDDADHDDDSDYDDDDAFDDDDHVVGAGGAGFGCGFLVGAFVFEYAVGAVFAGSAERDVVERVVGE